MSSKPAETQSSNVLDTAKLLLALVLVVAAVAAFYYWSDYSQLARVIGLLAAVGIAAGIAVTTEVGAGFVGFTRDSRTELRKVVWPSRQETLQTTLAVVLMVIVMAIFLWLLDMLLFWIVRTLTG